MNMGERQGVVVDAQVMTTRLWGQPLAKGRHPPWRSGYNAWMTQAWSRVVEGCLGTSTTERPLGTISARGVHIQN